MFDEEQAVVELSAKGNGDNCEQSEINGDDGFRISNSNINSNIKSNSNDIKRYTEIPKGSFDINRIGNAIAIWTLILVWFWISMYWILVYVPFPPMGGGSEDNVFAYSDYVVKPIAEKLCPLTSPDKHGTECVWYYPAFAAFTVVALLVRKTTFRPRKLTGQLRLAGDFDFLSFAYIAIGIPLLIYFCFYMYKKWPLREDMTDTEFLADIFGTFANRIGFVSVWCLTFFMIPATRHGPVLAVLGWHPYHAMTVHMWCGWAAIATAYLHTFFYILKYSVGDYHKEAPGQRGWNYFFPPPMCFVPSHYSEGTNEDGTPMPPEGYKHCKKMLAGFFGTIALSFLTVLTICSMKFIRRNQYTVFYFAHILCAPMFLLFLILHYGRAITYIWPSLFYYFATQTPFLMQHWRYTVYNYGLKITDVMDIPCEKLDTNDDEDDNEASTVSTEASTASTMTRIKAIFSPKSIDWLDEKINRRGSLAKPVEHCISFAFEISEEGADQFYPGQYGNIWCPDASMKSHPFSITHVPGKRSQLRIIFRVFGKWTDLLARSLIQLPCPGHQQELLPIPKIMMDGFHGPSHLVGNALNHDKVILVVAGIGITAFLSMLTEMIELLCFNEDGMFIKMDEIEGIPQTKRIELHWTVRDPNLVKYITDEYFLPLMQKASRKERNGELNHDGKQDLFQGASCHIHIHRTGDAGAKCEAVDCNSLWNDFCDKPERGNKQVDFSLIGTFGSPWHPYRFSFGRWSTFYEHIPSISMFVAIFWCSYAFSGQVRYWLGNNFYSLPDAVNNAAQAWEFFPILLFSFVFAFIGHVLMDWKQNLAAKNKRQSPDETTSSPPSSFIQISTVDDEMLSSDVVQTKILSINSTAGRPTFEKMLLYNGHDHDNVDEDDNDNDNDNDKSIHNSTGIFMCGPSGMIDSCKKATPGGLASCNTKRGERIQNFFNGNKFVFYEEKFSW